MYRIKMVVWFFIQFISAAKILFFCKYSRSFVCCFANAEKKDVEHTADSDLTMKKPFLVITCNEDKPHYCYKTQNPLTTCENFPTKRSAIGKSRSFWNHQVSSSSSHQSCFLFAVIFILVLCCVLAGTETPATPPRDCRAVFWRTFYGDL